MQATSPVVFTHIQKTAGSTIHTAAYRAVGEDRWFVVRDHPDVDTLRAMPKADRDQLLYVGGHIDFRTAYDLFPDACFITALREPLSRMLSHYFYLVREQGFELDREAEDMMMEGFRRFYYDAEDNWLCNLQCRTVSGEPDHAFAIETLRKHYTLVWDSAETTSIWPHVKQLLPDQLDDQPAFENIYVAPVASGAKDMASGARPKDYMTFLPDKLRKQVLEENAEDIALYRTLRTDGWSGMLFG